MGKQVGPPITDSDKQWILQQKVFFHASAPLSRAHKVNLSPKSAAEFRVIDEHTVAWLDLSGSGSETCAHLLENGRLTIMFVALNGPPRILRLFGHGQIVLPRALRPGGEFSHLGAHFEGSGQANPGFRAIVLLRVVRATSSCGFSIPRYEYICERPTLPRRATRACASTGIH
jgi:hypothetical protein